MELLESRAGSGGEAGGGELPRDGGRAGALGGPVVPELVVDDLGHFRELLHLRGKRLLLLREDRKAAFDRFLAVVGKRDEFADAADGKARLRH